MTVRIKGRFDVICYEFQDGPVRWKATAHNLVTNVGVDDELDVHFHAAAQHATWYIGLIRDDNWSAIAAADTMASHAGWEEANEYAGDRKEWTEGAASGQSITNAVSVDFTMNDTEVIKGAFLNTAATLTAGVLYDAAVFDEGDQACVSGNVLAVTLTLSLADDGV